MLPLDPRRQPVLNLCAICLARPEDTRWSGICRDCADASALRDTVHLAVEAMNAKTAQTWTYAGWCEEPFCDRAVDPGHAKCPGCRPWSPQLERALDADYSSRVLDSLDWTP